MRNILCWKILKQEEKKSTTNWGRYYENKIRRIPTFVLEVRSLRYCWDLMNECHKNSFEEIQFPCDTPSNVRHSPQLLTDINTHLTDCSTLFSNKNVKIGYFNDKNCKSWISTFFSKFHVWSIKSKKFERKINSRLSRFFLSEEELFKIMISLSQILFDTIKNVTELIYEKQVLDSF